MSINVSELEAAGQRAQDLFQQFNADRDNIAKCTKPTRLNVTGVILKVVTLSECIGSICPMDAAAYLGHSEALVNGTVDAGLNRLTELTTTIFSDTKRCETNLQTDLDTTQKLEERVNDFIARAEMIEKDISPLIAAVETEKTEMSLQFLKAKNEAETAKAEVESAESAYQEALRNHAEKRRVNDNLISGLGDWFSRSDASIQPSSCVRRLSLIYGAGQIQPAIQLGLQ